MSSSATDAKAKDAQSQMAREKKRRRTLKKNESRSSSPDSTSKKSRATAGSADNKQSARELFYHEESTVMERDSQGDMQSHQAACTELKNIMSQIKDLKEKYEAAGEDEQADILEQIDTLRIHGMMQFITLRKLNRLGHFRCKKVRENTTQAKQKIDQHQLQLQNLLYEVMHLQKEINKCLDFKSKDEEIELVSTEEFYKEAPDGISKPAVTKEDPHQQTLARLDWELEQRKRQSEQLKEAEKHKDSLSADIRTKKEHLESLQPKLSTILQATKPVQDYLGMPFDEVREQHRTATYLPRALYVLYMQATAYKDACDKSLEVNIIGDVDEARSMQSATIDIDDDSGDSDQEEQEKPSEKRRRRNTTADDRGSQRREKLLQKHALSVDITVQCQEDCSLLLSFYYLVALEIVTVRVKLSTRSENSGSNIICAGDLLSSDTLLRCLYSGDTGEDTPNPSNKYAFKRLGLGDFGQYISEVGKPYQWTQGLCGLKFLKPSEFSESTGTKTDLVVSSGHMDGTIKRLRQRVRARLSLQKQLAALERCSVNVSSDYQSFFPTKLSSRLASWKRSTYEDFSVLPYCQPIVNVGLAHPLDLFFTAVIERGSAKLTAKVVVSADYPGTAPVFALQIRRTEERSRLNDNHIRDLEAEVNVHYVELVKKKSDDQLLINQVQRLLMCFDVYLETEASNPSLEGPVEFGREKILPRMARGPQRANPYTYNVQLGFFTQR